MTNKYEAKARQLLDSNTHVESWAQEKALKILKAERLSEKHNVRWLSSVIQEVRDIERERCAKVCDRFSGQLNKMCWAVPRSIAKAIRAGEGM